MRLGLRAQILLLLGAVLAAVIILVGIVQVAVTRASLIDARGRELRAEVAFLARAADDLCLAESKLDHARRRELVGRLLGAFAGQEGHHWAAVVRKEGMVLESTPGAPLAELLREPLVEEALRAHAPGDRFEEATEARGAQMVVAAPVERAADGEGAVVAAVTLASLAAPMGRAIEALLLYLGLDVVALLVFGYILLTRFIVRPVEEITAAVERVAGGQIGIALPVRGHGELGRLARSFNAMTAEIARQRADLDRRIGELTRANQELAAARVEILEREKLAVVGRLAAGVAHEIGNPLQAILGFSEILRSDLASPAGAPRLPDESRADMLARVSREIERISGIVGSLVEYARPRPLQVGAVDLRRIVEDAVALLAPQPRLRGVEVAIECDDPLPPVESDAGGLTQVLVNLLLNAGDALKGQGRVTVTVRRADDGAAVEISVADTGPGIPAEHLPHLFEPFFTTKGPGEGSGLGLAMCQRIADSLGAEIRVASEPGQGARFTVRLASRRC